MASSKSYWCIDIFLPREQVHKNNSQWPMLSVHLFICVLCAFSLQSTENIVVENIIFWQKIFDIDDTVDRKSFCTIKRIYQCFETFTNWKGKPIPNFLSNESSLPLFISISSLYNTVWTLYRYLTLEEWFYLSTQQNILLFLSLVLYLLL